MKTCGFAISNVSQRWHSASILSMRSAGYYSPDSCQTSRAFSPKIYGSNLVKMMCWFFACVFLLQGLPHALHPSFSSPRTFPTARRMLSFSYSICLLIYTVDLLRSFYGFERAFIMFITWNACVWMLKTIAYATIWSRFFPSFKRFAYLADGLFHSWSSFIDFWLIWV